MKTNSLVIDFNNSEIIMDRAFAKNAKIVGSDQYNLLQGARRDYPTYSVTQRTIRKNPNKESYRGLTYDYMREYIIGHSDDITLREFEEKVLISKCHSIRYPEIKKWFLNTFPEIEEFNSKKQKQTELQVA